MRYPPQGHDYESITKVVWADANTAYAVGWGGTLLKSTDAGLTWVSVAPDPADLPWDDINNAPAQLWDVSAADANHVMVVGYGGVILRTSDGGSTWQRSEFPPRPYWIGSETPGDPLWYSWVQMVDAERAYVEASGTVLKTDDGGEHWYWLDQPWTSTSSSVELLDFTALDTGELVIPLTRTSGTDRKNRVAVTADAFIRRAPIWPAGSSVTVATRDSEEIGIMWSLAHDDSGVTGYKVYVNGSLRTTVSGSTTSCRIGGLSPATTYTIKVEAGNTQGLWSTNGPSVSVATESVPDDDTGPGNLLVHLDSGTTRITASDQWITSRLGSQGNNVVLEARGSRNTRFQLSLGAANTIANRDGTLTFSSDLGEVTFPVPHIDAGRLPPTTAVECSMYELSAEESAKVLRDLPREIRPASGVIEVTIKVGGDKDLVFEKRVRLVVACPSDTKLRSGQLFVYRINDDGSLECVGKEVILDSEGNIVGFAAEIDHLSKYAVFEFENPFVDTAGHWAERDISYLAARGVVTGVSEDRFEPERSVTRAEFVVMLVRALQIQPGDGKVFDDTGSHWAREYIAAAASQGIVTGYDENNFGPDTAVTREQMAAMVVRALGLAAGGDPGASFADADDISAWARAAIDAAVQNQVLSGYPDHSFRPGSLATRAEAVTIVTNSLAVR